MENDGSEVWVENGDEIGNRTLFESKDMRNLDMLFDADKALNAIISFIRVLWRIFLLKI